MNPELKIVIYEQKNIIKKLLSLLDEQYEYVINKDVIKMDMIAKQLDDVAKELASAEIKRINIMGKDASLSEIVEKCDDEQIKSVYEDINTNLRMIEIQKEANETLIKQRLFFTKKMMNYIKPNQGVGAYNAHGQVGK